MIGGERQNGQAVVVQPAVQQVHEVEQKLAHDLEHPEIHHLGFVVRKLRETMVKFRAGVDFKTRAVAFARVATEIPACPIAPSMPEQLLVRRVARYRNAGPTRQWPWR